MINRFTAIGAAAVLAALALFAASAGFRTAGAQGATIVIGTPTPTATATPCGGIILTSYDPQAAPCTPVPPPVRTATPTATQAVATNTAAATATTAPATSVPNTPVPPTAAAGGIGAGIQAPNTGTGGGASGGGSSWALAAGGALLALGGGSLVYGGRRRR